MGIVAIALAYPWSLMLSLGQVSVLIRAEVTVNWQTPP